MKLGIAIDENWVFFDEIYADLQHHFQTSLFERREYNLPLFYARVNRYLFYRDLRAFMKANDVVFFEWAGHLLAAASHLPKSCGIVARLHRYEMYEWADQINWQSVDKVILVSKAKQREFIARFPEHAAKTEVLYESISLDKFTRRPKKFNGDIGILCHLVPRKRVYELVLAFSELIHQGRELRLHIGGGRHQAHKDYYSAIHHLVQSLNMQDKITFYGHVSDPWNWYPQIDIFISNSYSEGLQVAPMEAMASGCYCLAHWWEGAEELVPEENLFFTNRELQEKIVRYCEIPDGDKEDLRMQMREIACNNFDIEQTKVQIRQAIDEVGMGTGALAIPENRRLLLPLP
jgi:glycosyltransferase involved in cell wall biosynthesis